MSRFSDLLHRARLAAGLTRAELARALGVSADTVASWESGRRRPPPSARSRIIEAADLLGIEAGELNAMLAGLGADPVPPERIAPLAERRRTLEAIRAECAAYPWPTLAMNEDFEVVAWNEAANDLSELDFATDLAEPGARHLLRMALSDHYREKLRNWDQVIGVMVSMWKSNGFDPLTDAARTPYFDNLINFIAANHTMDVARLLGLWQSSPTHVEGSRVFFPADWRTSDGTALRFNCQLTSWSEYDGVSAFDWHPADAATWDWLTSRARLRPLPADGAAETARVTSARELLRFERERTGFTQRQLAECAGMAEDMVQSMESGRRGLTEAALVRLGRAMALPAIDLNELLQAAGFPPRPSDLIPYILGYPLGDDSRFAGGTGLRMNWTPATVARELDRYPWPGLVVDGRCEIVAASRSARALLGPALPPPGPGPARNLFAVVTTAAFRESAANWGTAVANVLPGNLGAYIAPPGARPPPAKDEAYFATVVEHVLARERDTGGDGPALVQQARMAWLAKRDRRPASRIAFTLDWRQASRELRFDVVITPWSSMRDPYWAIDLHPAGAETWRELGR